MHALFYTLLHSLWQGILLAIAAGLTLTLTKRSTSQARYILLCGLLVLFVTGTILTFYCETSLVGQSDEKSTNVYADYHSAASTQDHNRQSANIIDRVIHFVKSNENDHCPGMAFDHCF
jgi:hypothetical protein